MAETTQPAKVYRTGNLQIAIWENVIEQNGQSSTRRSAKITKRFCDQDGNWRETDIMFAGDLFRIAVLSQRAAEWIELKEDGPGDGGTGKGK